MYAGNMSDDSLDSSRLADPQQSESELLRVCRIGRAQGLKGEVTIQTFTDEPERRFAPGASLYSHDGGHTYTVAHSRTFKNRWILHLSGVNDRDASEALNGLELYAPADSFEVMADEDAWYPKDLIGLTAQLASSLENGVDMCHAGADIGKVVDVIDGPGQSLLKIRLATPMLERSDGSYTPADTDAVARADESAQTGNRKKGNDKGPKVVKTALIPFVDELVPDIDLEARILTLDPPVGLIPGL
jgi:16S rRNA processing protein RimM